MALSPLRARLALRTNRILEDSFVCRRCLHQQRTTPPTRQTPFLSAFRKPGHFQTPVSARLNSSASIQASPILSQASSSSRSNPSSFPRTSHRSVAYWLLGSASSVFGIVIFGGLTRLTESGLSITEWRPVTGSFPPLSQADWTSEFNLYKQSPEFKMLNSRMELEDFKQIYWMEWGHRLWGRVVGITFLVPTLYFVARRRVSKSMAYRLTGICALIGCQGAIGWWMVKSGLKDELLETGSHPRVSQYRLTAHLGTAFLAYLAMLWNGLTILRQHALLASPVASISEIQHLNSPALKPFRRLSGALFVLTFGTAMTGALVAGLDAGLIYNDFPWMGGAWTPPKSELFNAHYSHTADNSDMWWRNFTENPALAQLTHRCLAVTTASSILALTVYSRFIPLPPPAKSAMLGVLGLVSVQVTLGITTLWYLVPTPLAATHQAGALALLSGVLVLGRRVWVGKQLINAVRKPAKKVLKQRGMSDFEAEGAVRMAHPIARM